MKEEGDLDRVVSRSHVQKLLSEGAVTVGDQALKKSASVHCGDVITVVLPDPIPLEAQPQQIPIDIVYEDESLIVVNKARGMVVHPAAGNPDGTLVNALLWHCRGNLSGINGVQRPGIVHRIDKDTSGLIVICKTDEAYRGLAEQFFEHSVRRTYAAIVQGRFREPSGTVDAPIGRDPKNRKRFAAVQIGGKRAVTHYEVLEQFRAYSLVEARLETGRTHQIRVHLSALGHPLLGDELYGGKKEFGLTGQCLHAKTLGFRHPVSGEEMDFDSELPEYFAQILEKLRKIGE